MLRQGILIFQRSSEIRSIVAFLYHLHQGYEFAFYLALPSKDVSEQIVQLLDIKKGVLIGCHLGSDCHSAVKIQDNILSFDSSQGLQNSPDGG